MRNLLQVFINDEGELDFSSDNELCLDEIWSLDNLKQSKKGFRKGSFQDG